MTAICCYVVVMAQCNIIAIAFKKGNFIVFTQIWKYDPQIRNHLKQLVKHQRHNSAFSADEYEGKSKHELVVVYV